ncbi:hypothetical protein Trydic_g1690 [Trypoxylus dichotomus]
MPLDATNLIFIRRDMRNDPMHLPDAEEIGRPRRVWKPAIALQHQFICLVVAVLQRTGLNVLEILEYRQKPARDPTAETMVAPNELP